MVQLDESTMKSPILERSMPLTLMFEGLNPSPAGPASGSAMPLDEPQAVLKSPKSRRVKRGGRAIRQG
jgi:hypothetical protein